MSIEQLPAEILRKIFQHLRPPDKLWASLVCWRWYYVVLDSGIGEELYILLQSNICYGMSILQRSQNKFSNLVVKDDDLNRFVSQFWQNIGRSLKRLNFQSCDISEKVFIQILECCPHLESLSLCGCNALLIPGTLLEKQSDILKLQESLKHLKELDLSNNKYLSDALFNRFVEVFPDLEKLSVAGCQMSFHPGIYKRFYPSRNCETVCASGSVLTFQNIMKYVESCKRTMRSLNFSRSLIESTALETLVRTCNGTLDEVHLVSCEQLTIHGISALCAAEPQLKVLNLSLNYQVTDQMLTLICDNLPELQELYLSRCHLLTNKSVCEITHLEKLQKLDLSACHKVSPSGFAQALGTKPCPNLRNLNLSFCNITDETLKSFSIGIPKLTHLDLTSCGLISDTGLQIILQYFPHLRSLKLAWCKEISDSGILGYSPAENKPGLGSENSTGIKYPLSHLKGLCELDLCGCCKLTNEGLEQAISFLELKYLNLSTCNNLLDSGMLAIGSNNPGLESLILCQCSLLTDAGMIQAIPFLHRLKYLDVQGCCRLTDKTLISLVKCCQSLRHLNVSFCNISPSVIAEMESMKRTLHIIHTS